MKILIPSFALLLFIVALFSCKKPDKCDVHQYVDTYYLKDSIVNTNGTITLENDTVIVEADMAGINVNLVIYRFGTDKVLLEVVGCPENFTIDSLYTYKGSYSGSGSFSGNNLKMKVHFQPDTYNYQPPYDTLNYYCSGVKQ